MAKATTKTAAVVATNVALVVRMSLERETKGAVRYQEIEPDGGPVSIEEGAKIGTLYIRKAAFGDGKFPQHISITIEPA